MNIFKKEPEKHERIENWEEGYECPFCKHLQQKNFKVCPNCGEIKEDKPMIAIRLHTIYINDGLYWNDIIKRFWEKK